MTTACHSVHTRIAPTPSGLLHQGNALSFVLTHAIARGAIDRLPDELKGWLGRWQDYESESRGTILLRIDDLDARRVRAEYIEDIFETLDWLGIDWDSGPENPGAFADGWSQCSRIGHYERALGSLARDGHLFACSCSRKQIGSALHGESCRNDISLASPNVAWRVRVPPETMIIFDDLACGTLRVPLGERMGSFVVRGRDGTPSYQIASVVDDLHFGIDFIVRGADLIESTAAQLYLARLLGLESFVRTRFIHHPVIFGVDGQKLSKSRGSQTLAELKRSSYDLTSLIAKDRR